MFLNDELRKEYQTILKNNGLTEREFKQLFRGKSPGLKFRIEDDLKFVTFYIGCDSLPYTVEIAKIKVDSILKCSKYNDYDTIQVMLISTYCIDRLVGSARNIFRNRTTTDLDKGIKDLVIHHILTQPELFYKSIKNSTTTDIKFEIVTIESGKIPKEVLKNHPWIFEGAFTVQNENILILCPLENCLEIAIKIFSSKFIAFKDFYKFSADYNELKNMITDKYKKIIIANI